MENPEPELSPDIEWILESGQASTEMQAEALVRTCLQPVYRFWLACLDDAQLANQMSVKSLTAALTHTYRYRGGSVQVWLFQIVLGIYRKKQPGFLRPRFPQNKPRIQAESFDSRTADLKSVQDEQFWGVIRQMGRKNLPIFLLIYLLNWPTEQAADVLQTTPETINSQLEIMRRKLIGSMSSAGYSLDELESDRLDAHIRQLVGNRWPELSLSSEKVEDTILAVLAGSRQQRSRHYQLASTKEFLLVAVVISLAAGLIYGGDKLFPEQDRTSQPVRTVLVTHLVEVFITTTPKVPSAPMATSTQTPQPELRMDGSVCQSCCQSSAQPGENSAQFFQ